MESRSRTHLINELMDEANLMMGMLEKAMQGERMEEMHPSLHGTHPAPSEHHLEDEHKSWGQVLRALTEIQLELNYIEQVEHQRLDRARPAPEVGKPLART